MVAVSESLYLGLQSAELPVGVNCLCPGWVRMGILDAEVMEAMMAEAAAGQSPESD